MTHWRTVIAAAIRDGDEAEAALSARDRDVLLGLHPEQRKAIVDGKVDDPRFVDLLPADKEAVRESLGGPGRRPAKAKVDPAKVAAERRAARIAILQRYRAAYQKQLLSARPALAHTAVSELVEAVRRGGRNKRLETIAAHYAAVMQEIAALKKGGVR